MIAIGLTNISLSLGAHLIFDHLSWEIQDDQRIGLIGPNGAGKSSLLKLIVGEHAPEPGGLLARARGLTIGYLPQQPELDPDQTVLAAALAGNARLAEVEAELERLETKLGDPAVYGDEKALARTLDAQEKALAAFAELGGATYATRAQDLLLGLGLTEADFPKPVGTLSGGQKKLVGLARLLLARPTVLLLDEPDNHLDLAGKTFLEGLIRDYPGAVVLVSHDRYLLDAVVTHIAEIEDGRLTTFNGDYSNYILDKETRLARQEELYQVQQRTIARMEAAIKRYAQWVVFNDKFASRLRATRTRLERLESLERPTLERKRMGLSFAGWRGSTNVLELKKVSKAYGQTRPLQGVDLLVRHGERVGLIGANGAGKSVLLRLILGRERPDAGDVRVGPSVQLGYYAQEHETLDLDQTPLEAVRHAAYITEEGAVSFLKRYLFTYRQTSQKIGTLSGGERSRLQLALLALPGRVASVNCLLLDEPTNNLDIASAEVLEDALAEFEGTVIVISHDRYFLDRVVERTLELKGGRLREYEGGYSDYVEAQRNRRAGH
ncbi:MAG TPA: ABC-F family ATP-binding cassette domain-containing protein [Anaerolineales bacterium]|nr:ABC-F family ATP-binding cassette domain-containing protein [Anaerolineales bacterium]